MKTENANAMILTIKAVLQTVDNKVMGIASKI